MPTDIEAIRRQLQEDEEALQVLKDSPSCSNLIQSSIGRFPIEQRACIYAWCIIEIEDDNKANEVLMRKWSLGAREKEKAKRAKSKISKKIYEKVRERFVKTFGVVAPSITAVKRYYEKAVEEKMSVIVRVLVARG